MEQRTVTYASAVMHFWAVVTWNTALKEEDFKWRGNVQEIRVSDWEQKNCQSW